MASAPRRARAAGDLADKQVLGTARQGLEVVDERCLAGWRQATQQALAAGGAEQQLERAFAHVTRPLSVAEMSHRVRIPRAAVRRLLHTLCELG